MIVTQVTNVDLELRERERGFVSIHVLFVNPQNCVILRIIDTLIEL